MLALPSLHSRVRDDTFPILQTWMNSITDDSTKAASELFISVKSESKDLRWHKSKEKPAGKSPFGSYLMNQKYTLEEEFNNHLLRLQVTVGYIFSNQVQFCIPGLNDWSSPAPSSLLRSSSIENTTPIFPFKA